MSEIALFLVREASKSAPLTHLDVFDEAYYAQLYTYDAIGCFIFHKEYEMCYYPGRNTPNVSSICFEC